MNARLFLLISTITTLSTTAFASINCPDGLPQELLRDCNAAESAAQTDESGPDYFGFDQYNVTEKLQSWVDRQMQLDVARESAEPTGSDLARHLEDN